MANDVPMTDSLTICTVAVREENFHEFNLPSCHATSPVSLAVERQKGCLNLRQPS